MYVKVNKYMYTYVKVNKYMYTYVKVNKYMYTWVNCICISMTYNIYVYVSIIL